jgi:hypothetical protein
MRRRKFLGHVGKAVAAAGAAQLMPDRVFARSDRMTMAAVGDCVITRKVSERRDPRFLDLVELLRSADCTWGNCEMIFHEANQVYPTPKGRDMNVICEPWGADELKWMGFDVVGNANNHTMDYGAEGLRGTLANLDRGSPSELCAHWGFSPGVVCGSSEVAALQRPSWLEPSVGGLHISGRTSLLQ